MDAPTLSEIWKSPEWKAQAAAFKEGKPCAWCGAKPGDTYTTRKGKTRKLGFSVHHIEKHKWGLPLYNQVKNQMFRDYWKERISRPMFLFPIQLSRKEYRVEQKYIWENSHREEIQTAFQEEKERRRREERIRYFRENFRYGSTIVLKHKGEFYFWGECNYFRFLIKTRIVFIN